MRSSRRCVNLQQLGALFLDDVLRIVEAAAALDFAAESGIGFFGRRGTGAGSLANLRLSDPVADADDHWGRYNR